MNEIKVRMIKEGPFEINEELAGLVPMAGETEQAILTQDISDNQQREPIVLWRNKVVDGRCRQKALTLLKHNILYKELDSDLTEEEVRIYVKSVNTRRNLTHTQKVITAVKESIRPNSKSVHKIAKAWGVSISLLENGRYIARHKPEFIDPLFNGKEVTIIDCNGKEITSNKVSTIYAFIKRDIDNAVEDNQYGWNENSTIRTQLGKDWYYGFIKSNNITNIPTKMALAELANYKFNKIDIK